MQKSFDIRQSQIVKGVAILLMLWHHCFLSGRFEQFPISFSPLTPLLVSQLASWFKICVSLFAFVSGYGLHQSYRNWKSEHPSCACSGWIWRRYVRTFSDYWLVIVLAWIVCGMVDGRPIAVYFSKSRVAGIMYALLDLMGLGKIFDSPLLVGEWWYMSAAALFIILLPVLYALQDRFGSALCFSALCFLPRAALGYPGGMNPLSFLPAFFLGMAFAKNNLFSVSEKLLPRSWTAAALLCLSAGCFLFDRRLGNSGFWPIKWGVFPAVIALCIYHTVARIPVVSDVLAFLGRRSAFIYLTHSFFIYIYLRQQIMGLGHFQLILAALLAVSLLTSLVLERLKKLIRYDRLIAKLQDISLSRVRDESGHIPPESPAPPQ